MDSPSGELLVEQQLEDGYAQRVHRDGSVFEHTDVSARLEGGQWRFEHQPPAWRKVVSLPREAVESIEETIRREHIMNCPARIDPEGTVKGGRLITWTVAVDGKRHTIELLVGAEQAEPFASLDKAIQVAVAKALDAESQTSESDT